MRMKSGNQAARVWRHRSARLGSPAVETYFQRPVSDIANLRRMAQCRDRIFPSRNEFLSHVAAVTGFQDGSHHGGVVNLLSVIQLPASRITGRVIVADVILV